MKAVRLRSYNEMPVIEDVPEPSIQSPLDVIVKIGGAGVCRTDLHIILGQWAEAMNQSLPYTLAHYLGSQPLPPVTVDHDAFKDVELSVQGRIDRLLSVKGSKTPRQLHRELGAVLWDDVGMARNELGLRRALARIPQLREEFWQDVSVPGPQNNLNKNLEYAGRVADYLEFAELLALDALHRTESCGGHFREESQTPDGEALRDDDHFSYVAAWQFEGVGEPPVLHTEPLVFDYVKPSQRSYK